MSETGNDRIKKLEDVLRKIVQADSAVPSEIDGDRSCFYCNAYLEGGEPHTDDCPYTEAKRLLGEGLLDSGWRATECMAVSKAEIEDPLFRNVLNGWFPATNPPSGEIGKWSAPVVCFTNLGNLFRLSYFQGIDEACWQRPGAFADGERVEWWKEEPKL